MRGQKRVTYIPALRNQAPIRGRGGIGRRVRFRSVWGQPHGGSSPLARTIRNRKTRFGGSFSYARAIAELLPVLYRGVIRYCVDCSCSSWAWWFAAAVLLSLLRHLFSWQVLPKGCHFSATTSRSFRKPTYFGVKRCASFLLTQRCFLRASFACYYSAETLIPWR